MIKQIKLTLLILVVGLSISFIILILKEQNNQKNISKILEINENYELVYNLNNELENKKNLQKELENQNNEIDKKIKDTKNEINNLYNNISKYEK